MFNLRFMLKVIHFVVVLFICQLSLAQDYSLFLNQMKDNYTLTEFDVSETKINSSYHRKETNMTHVYLNQTVNGIEILNAILQLHIRDEKELVFHNSTFIPNAKDLIDEVQPTLSMEHALQLCLNKLDVSLPSTLPFIKNKRGVLEIQYPEKLKNPIRCKLIYFKNQLGNLQLAYKFNVEPKGHSESWLMVVSAIDGALILQHNLTTNCEFDHSDCTNIHTANKDGDVNKSIGEAVYFAYPLGTESPLHGPRVSLNSVELSAASPFGWHDVNGSPGAEFNITRGNNCYAHEDIADLDEPGYSPSGGSNLVFNFPFLEGQDPNLSVDASITNLFVWNNFMHDVSFFYGFDEESGNFQQKNYSSEGFEEDFVYAHALDGSGTNNANFGTPEDGYNPYMQMYIWEHTVGDLLEITSPSNIAGTYTTGSSSFGVPPPTTPLNAEVVLVNDGSSNPTHGCGTLNSSLLSGKIAYMDRGTCTFADKVLNAQNAGAVAVVIANNQPGGAMSMGGDDFGQATIPVVSVSQSDGALIKQQLLSPTPVFANFGGSYQNYTFDSSFDNGIIAHEYGHGISNRLTGGPNDVYCLGNEEQMGEGWSDFFALIISDQPGSVGELARGIGNYASNRPVDGLGIRPYPYSTDLDVNPLTYQNIQSLSVPHGVGSVWCTMLWEMYWAFVNEYGHSYDLYSSTGGNNMAIRLVMEGMRIQTCNPGFQDGRDAILAADQILYNGDHQCLIWEAFAKRGLGFDASQGSSYSVTDGQESFDMPSFCFSNIQENEMNSFTLFPNPSTGTLAIKSSERILQVNITSLSGQMISSIKCDHQEVVLDESHLDAGMYIIQVVFEKSTQLKSWIKVN